MSPQELERAGTALFGERFRSALASALGVSKGAITNWLDGKPIPGSVIAAIKAWLRIHELSGELPPISPGSDQAFDPASAPTRGRKPKYVGLLDAAPPIMPRIVIDPEVMSGDPCLEGTRIPVETILLNLAAGVTEEELMKAYPTLPKGSVAAAKRWERELGLVGGSSRDNP